MGSWDKSPRLSFVRRKAFYVVKKKVISQTSGHFESCKDKIINLIYINKTIDFSSLREKYLEREAIVLNFALCFS